jgi:hypothetical protein
MSCLNSENDAAMLTVQTIAGTVLKRNVPGSTSDDEICRLAQAAFNDAELRLRENIPAPKYPGTLVKIVQRDDEANTVSVMLQNDVQTLLGHPEHDPEMFSFAQQMGWTEDKQLDDWTGCAFQGATLILLDLQAIDFFASGRLTLPTTLGRCVLLTHFGIWSSTLQKLPEIFDKFPRLTKFDCNGCSRLQCLPETLGACAQLTVLTCQWCVLVTRLPESLSNCRQLVKIFCGSCKQLERLPERLIDCINLCVLVCNNCFMLNTLPQSLVQHGKFKTIRTYACCGQVRQQAQCIMDRS